MKKEKICGIYLITNLINGKMYVGQSVDIYHRWTDHRAPSTWEHRPGPMYNDMELYGTEYFELSILEKCDKTELNEREYYWTTFLKTHITGYNRDIGHEHNTESKQKMSEASKGNTNTRGRIWINNNFDEKLIYPQELEKYIELGYQRGMK